MFLLPSYYKNSDVMKEILQSAELEISNYKTAEENTSFAFFVIKTPNITENELDVGIAPDPTISLELRRHRVLARLRSTPDATKQKIIEIARAFFDGEIDVIEHNSEYMVEVDFVGYNGEPEALADMENAIKDIIPAHLVLSWLLHFSTNNDIHQYTHNYLHGYTHEQIRRLN